MGVFIARSAMALTKGKVNLAGRCVAQLADL